MTPAERARTIRWTPTLIAASSGRHAVLVAVGQRLGGEEAAPAPADVLEDGVGALDPQVGLELAGEAGAGQVLGHRARADRHRQRLASVPAASSA